MYIKFKEDKNNYKDAMYPCLMSINGPYMMVGARRLYAPCCFVV